MTYCDITLRLRDFPSILLRVIHDSRMRVLNILSSFAISYNLILASMLISAAGLGIDTQLTEKSVNLLCFNANQGIALMSRMTQLKLRKLSANDNWMDLVLLHDNGSTELFEKNITVEGDVGEVFSSFLNASWPLNPQHRYEGRYRCDATGRAATGENIVEESAEVDLRAVPSETSLLCRRFQRYETEMNKKFQDVLNGMNSSFSDILDQLNSTFGNLIFNLDKKMAEMKKIKDKEEEEEEKQREEEDLSWPEGNFTLLMPDTGCPSNPPAWNKGFVKMRAENNDRYYPLNAPKHMALPYSKDGFVYQHFCSLTQSYDRQQRWPLGTYCIQTFSGSCAMGFYLTKVVIDMKTDRTGNLEFGTFPTTKNFWADKLYYFCCRHDGSPSTPIQLPTSNPFYLYRHKGQCQKVKDMQVTQDFFVMATANDNNGGSWGTGLASYRPDITIKPFTEELCYYWKK